MSTRISRVPRVASAAGCDDGHSRAPRAAEDAPPSAQPLLVWAAAAARDALYAAATAAAASGGCQAIVKRLVLFESDPLLLIGIESPFIGRMSFGNVNDEKVGPVLQILVHLLQFASLA